MLLMNSKKRTTRVNEDGHDDVPSAVRAMKTMAEDALEMLDALEQMDGTLFQLGGQTKWLYLPLC
jgi:hypothetical protein